MSNLEHEEFTRKLSEQSQVKQNNSKRTLRKSARLSILILVVLLCGFAYLTSHSHT